MSPSRVDPSLQEWATGHLTKVLGFEADDMAEHILAMDDDGDIGDYCQSVLGERDGSAFALELIRRREPRETFSGKGGDKGKDTMGGAYMKPTTAPVFMAGTKGAKGTGKGESAAQRSSLSSDATSTPSSSTKPSSSSSSEPTGDRGEASGGDRAKPSKGRSAAAKVPFGGLPPDPQRPRCECQARAHPLLGNCLACGRIVCENEGKGPCTFCGLYLIGADSTQQAAHARKVAMRAAEADAAMSAKALRNKERLMEFQRDRARRTVVYDDQSDYFSSSSLWINEDERAAALEREEAEYNKRHGSRLGQAVSVSLDVAGRTFIDEEARERDEAARVLNAAVHGDAGAREIRAGSSSVSAGAFSSGAGGGATSVPDSSRPAGRQGQSIAPAPDLGCDRPAFLASDTFLEGVTAAAAHAPRLRSRRVMHEDELASPVSHVGDVGLTLSMHQPWASLLVAGIKRFEGRSWNTEHRGRLWIASTVQEPEEGLCEGVEEAYRDLWESCGEADAMPAFPHFYPTGVLLGFVEVVDVIENDPNSDNPPPEDNDSPFLFACERPRELLVPMRVSGAHKIWKVDKDTLLRAQRAIDIQVG